jgi:DNA-binding IclR family transcriptional regulator
MIQVIHRALNILELIAKERDKELGLSEIADSQGLNHGTCANIIKTLVARNYIVQVGKKQGYKLGPQAYYLTNNYSNKKELLKASIGPMKALSTKLNESCILAIIKDNMRITLHKEQCNHELQAVTSNDEKNIYLTATGRMILACMLHSDQELFIQKYGLPNEMWPEIKSKEDMLMELQKIKLKQVCAHFADSHIVGIAVPIYKNDIVVASLGVYLPEVRFTFKTQEQIFFEINKSALLISQEMGRVD